jgi:hypothetical protein
MDRIVAVVGEQVLPEEEVALSSPDQANVNVFEDIRNDLDEVMENWVEESIENLRTIFIALWNGLIHEDANISTTQDFSKLDKKLFKPKEELIEESLVLGDISTRINHYFGISSKAIRDRLQERSGLESQKIAALSGLIAQSFIVIGQIVNPKPIEPEDPFLSGLYKLRDEMKDKKYEDATNRVRKLLVRAGQLGEGASNKAKNAATEVFKDSKKDWESQVSGTAKKALGKITARLQQIKNSLAGISEVSRGATTVVSGPVKPVKKNHKKLRQGTAKTVA